MSIYFDLGTSEFVVSSEEISKPIPEVHRTAQEDLHSSITLSQKQVLNLQNENRLFREELCKKNEQIAILSQKSFELGKTFMKMVNQKDEYEEAINKYKQNYGKAKAKIETMRIKVAKIELVETEKQSIKNQAKFEKETAQRKFEQYLDRITKLVREGSNSTVLLEAIREIKKDMQQK